MSKKELIIKKCMKCGAKVEVLQDCTCDNCGIQCCGEQMTELVPNSVDAAVEKHVPNYEVKEGKLIVTVHHVMEEEHYIEWIAFVTDNKKCVKYLNPREEAKVHFKYVPGAILYAYCNKHGLWKTEIQ